MGQLRPPEYAELFPEIYPGIWPGLPEKIKVRLSVHLLHGDDSPPFRDMFFDVQGMAGAGRHIISVIKLVIVFYLAFQTDIGVGIAFDFDSRHQVRQDHDDIRPGFSHLFFFQNTYFSVHPLQKIKERLPYILIVEHGFTAPILSDVLLPR